jgi:hypothetical protein
LGDLSTEMIDRNFGRASRVLFSRCRILLAGVDALGNFSLGKTTDVSRRVVGRRYRLFRPLVER